MSEPICARCEKTLPDNPWWGESGAAYCSETCMVLRDDAPDEDDD